MLDNPDLDNSMDMDESELHSPEDEESEDVGNPGDSPHRRRTKSYRQHHETAGSLADAVRSVLGCMREHRLDLPLLLWAMSYNVTELVTDPLAKFECTALLSSTELYDLLKTWARPPQAHNQGTRSKGASATINHFGSVMEREMASVGEYMQTNVAELSEEVLLSIKISEVKAEVKHRAPTTWAVMLRCAWTERQEKENKLKDPETVCTNCEFVQLLTQNHHAAHPLHGLYRLVHSFQPQQSPSTPHGNLSEELQDFG